MRLALPLLSAVAASAASNVLGPTGLGKRDGLETCSGLSISSNNGDRKVVIVIDSSGSMSSTDPGDLRLSAARALNSFLVSNAEASGSVRADQVAVVGFAGSAYTVFEPGDPGDPKADSAISTIGSSGSTFIAGGVLEAIDKIAAMSGPTKDRSSIVVYTDGSDSNADELVNAINNATNLGIRVSFGFLDDRASAQPEEVLLAVRGSKGVYATITVAEGSINFVNYVLLNGLAYQDNPQGAGDRLLAGLASTQFISGSASVTMKYLAEQGEKANFTLVSFTGDTLDMEAKLNGQTLNTTKGSRTTRKFMEVVPPTSGDLDVVITASNSPTDGLFSVLTGSTAPIKNCTVGVRTTDTGLSTGAKAGIGVGVAAAVLGLLGAALAAYKHLSAPSAGANTTAPTLSDGETTAFQPGGEKLGPETTNSSIPTNHTGSGFDGNLTGQNPEGPVGPPPANPYMPLSGISGAPYAAVPPFVPPLMPPVPPNNTSKGSSSPHTGYQQHPYGPGNQYQQPPNGPNGYQNNLGPGNTPYNHTGSPFQGSHTSAGDSYSHSGSPSHGNSTSHNIPPSGPHTTSGPSVSPNHSTFDSGNHTNWGPTDIPDQGPQDGPPASGPGGHHPPQPFFTMPSPPTWTRESKHHHHEWLAPDTACEHPDCPLTVLGHRCAPTRETCSCTCRNPGCPVTKRGY